MFHLLFRRHTSPSMISVMVSADQYNSLPTVDKAHELSLDMIAVRQDLLDIINLFGLSDEFGVRLIHKHYDLVDNEAMVFRHVMVEGVCEAVVMGPLPISKAGTIEGKNFFIDVDSATLVPYEFTTNGGCDPSKYPDFVCAVAQAIAGSEARNVFGLAAKPNQLVEPYTEFELPDSFRSTVMVPTRMMPADQDQLTIYTNWVLEQELVDPITTGCLETRSGNHHPMACRVTRESHHRRRLGAELEAVVTRAIEVI